MKYLAVQHNNKKRIVAMRRVLKNGLVTQIDGIKYQLLSSYDDDEGSYLHPSTLYADNNGTSLTRVKIKSYSSNLLYRAPAVFGYDFTYRVTPEYLYNNITEKHGVVLWDKDLITDDTLSGSSGSIFSDLGIITFDNMNGVYLGKGTDDGYYSINGNKWIPLTNNSWGKLLQDIGVPYFTQHYDYDYFKMVLNNDGSVNYIYEYATFGGFSTESFLYYCEYHIPYIGGAEQITSHKGSKVVGRNSYQVEPLNNAGNIPADTSVKKLFTDEEIKEIHDSSRDGYYLYFQPEERYRKIPTNNVIYEPISQRYYTIASYDPVKGTGGATRDVKLGLFYCTTPQASLSNWTLQKELKDMTEYHTTGYFMGYNVSSFNYFK